MLSQRVILIGSARFSRTRLAHSSVNQSCPSIMLPVVVAWDCHWCGFHFVLVAATVVASASYRRLPCKAVGLIKYAATLAGSVNESVTVMRSHFIKSSLHVSAQFPFQLWVLALNLLANIHHGPVPIILE